MNYPSITETVKRLSEQGELIPAIDNNLLTSLCASLESKEGEVISEPLITRPIDYVEVRRVISYADVQGERYFVDRKSMTITFPDKVVTFEARFKHGEYGDYSFPFTLIVTSGGMSNRYEYNEEVLAGSNGEIAPPDLRAIWNEIGPVFYGSANVSVMDQIVSGYRFNRDMVN